MKSIYKKILVAAAILLPVVAYAASQTSNPYDKVLQGKSTAVNKDYVFNIGAGASNPLFRANASTGKLQFANDGALFKDIGSGSGGGGGIVLNENFGFEDGTTNWTASGGSFSINTTPANVGFGINAGAWDASATSQTLSGQTVTVPSGLFGKVCTLSWYYKGGDSFLKAQVFDGASVIAESAALTAQTNYSAKQVLYFTCPSSGTIRPRFISSGDAALVYLDDVKLGQEALFDVSNAGFVGRLKRDGVAGCSFTATSATYANFAAVAACNVGAATGDVADPGSKVPAITLLNAKAGDTYFFKASAYFGQNTNGDGCQFRFSDGVDSSEISQIVYNSGTFVSATGQIEGMIRFSTSGSKTVHIQHRYPFGVKDCTLQAAVANVPLVIEVYKLGSDAQKAITVDQAGWRIDGVIQGATADVTISSSTGATLTGFNDPNLTLNLMAGSAAAEIPCSATNPSTGTTCAAGSEQPGIVFTPPSAGVYEVCASPSTWHRWGSIGSADISWNWVETPNNAQTITVNNGKKFSVGLRTNTNTHNSDSIYSTRACETFTFSDTSKRTLRLFYTANFTGGGSIQGYFGGSTFAGVAPNIPVTVRRRVEFSDAIKFTNLVTTPRQTGDKIMSARITNTGGLCTLTSQTGSWIGTPTVNGTGDCTLPIIGGTFSAAPHCTCTPYAADNMICVISSSNAISPTLVRTLTMTTGGAPVNRDLFISCMGN